MASTNATGGHSSACLINMKPGNDVPIGVALDSSCEVRDHGDTWPLFLSVPPAQLLPAAPSRFTLQRMLSHWCAQAFDGVTALLHAPLLLAIQDRGFADETPIQA